MMTAVRFVAVAAAWVVGLFGLSRVPLVHQWLLEPLTRAQQQVALWHAGGRAPVLVTAECSAADVMALCLAATLAFPVAWKRRLAGAAGGLALILCLNTLRIGTLSATAGTGLFLPLHLYVWPAMLVLATLAYVAAWMWTAEGAPVPGGRRMLAFAFTAAGLVCLYLAAAPVLYGSALVRTAAAEVAAAGAAVMAALGATARSQGAVVQTQHGAFLVTAECVLTPLMPVYLAAVLALPRGWRTRTFAVLAFLPLFASLALARLFTLALPATVAPSPAVAIHGFYQLLLAAGAVGTVGWWAARRDGRSPWPRLAAAAAAGVATLALGGAYNALLLAEAAALQAAVPHALETLLPAGDVQGALLLLPAYQLGFFLALCLSGAERRDPWPLALGLLLLHAGHLLLIAALGELAHHTGAALSVVALRGWAFVAPVVLFVLLRAQPWLARSQPLPQPA